MSDPIRVGRVLHEDDDFITVEVAKNLSRSVNLNDGDRFLTLTFVHQVGGGVAPWVPWEQ